MSGHSKWSLDQAQEGRRRREARQALLEALARDHRRGQGGRPGSGRQPCSSERGREGALLLDAEGHDRACDREGRRRRAATRQRSRPSSYEGYGPEGVAVLVEALTDNRNRTAAEVRHLFSKHGGNLGASGVVAWQFERRGVVLVAAEGVDEDELVLAAAEGGADDVELDGSSSRSCPAPEALSSVRQAVEAAGFMVETAELSMVPKLTVAIDDEVDREAGRPPRRGARGERGRPGGLRQLRHPGAGVRGRRELISGIRGQTPGVSPRAGIVRPNA